MGNRSIYRVDRVRSVAATLSPNPALSPSFMDKGFRMPASSPMYHILCCSAEGGRSWRFGGSFALGQFAAGSPLHKPATSRWRHTYYRSPSCRTYAGTPPLVLKTADNGQSCVPSLAMVPCTIYTLPRFLLPIRYWPILFQGRTGSAGSSNLPLSLATMTVIDTTVRTRSPAAAMRSASARECEI
ncbi:hypothetical protein GQ53DRAFT_326753 [Thozetella sp. PMI_491]|nr:hypothetical protein GQ53DRAFT_326753 [Thozetella sp. PMI_491]